MSSFNFPRPFVLKYMNLRFVFLYCDFHKGQKDAFARETGNLFFLLWKQESPKGKEYSYPDLSLYFDDSFTVFFFFDIECFALLVLGEVCVFSIFLRNFLKFCWWLFWFLLFFLNLLHMTLFLKFSLFFFFFFFFFFWFSSLLISFYFSLHCLIFKSVRRALKLEISSKSVLVICRALFDLSAEMLILKYNTVSKSHIDFGSQIETKSSQIFVFFGISKEFFKLI